MGLSYTIAAGFASAVILRSEFRGTQDILLSQIRDSRNLEGQVPVFISHRNRVAQLYPQGTGFPFRRLLPLAGLRWRCSTPPPHGLTERFTRTSDTNPVRTSQETHYVSTTKTNRLMQFRETVAVHCENHTEHTNTLCGQNI
jgi:hypothetical protein